MSTYSYHLPQPYQFYLEKDLVNTVVELDTSEWAAVEPGDILQTSSGLLAITSVVRFGSLEELLNSVGVRGIFPDKANYSEAQEYFSTLHSPQEVSTFGLIALGIEKKN